MQTLRYDGLYFEPFDGSLKCRSFFRFYPDGTVVDVGVQAEGEPDLPQLVARWISREHPGLSVGRYYLKGDVVQMRIEVPALGPHAGGTIEYEGTFTEVSLALRSFSHLTNYAANLACVFREVTWGG